MFAQLTALVHHQYLIVYVHAANHPFVSAIVIVASLLFAYVVQLETDTDNVGAVLSTVIAALVLAFASLFHAPSCTAFAPTVNVVVVVAFFAVNVYVNVLDVVDHQAVHALIVHAFVLLNVAVGAVVHTHALLSVHVNTIVAVAPLFIGLALQFHQLHTGAVLSKYILSFAVEFVAKLFHALSLIAQLLHT